MSLRRARLFDLSALSLSSLCLAHCLALPMLAAALPALGAWAQAEWVHGVFVAFAIPITSLALWRANRAHPLPAAMLGLAGAGLLMLLLGALEWPSHALETPVTVTGSLLLAAAHIWNWRRHGALHANR